MRCASGAVAACVLDVFGLRPAPPHVGKRRLPVAVIDEAEAGKAALGRDQDRLAEGGGVEAEAHREPRAAALKSPGVIASWVTKRSCSRPGPERPTS